MKEYKTNEIRNIVLLGHANTGKTSLVEAILYYTGATTKLGRIAEGNTKSDYHSDEKNKQHSLSSTLLYCEHNKNKINMIDTAGYLDFISESKTFTRVADMGLIAINGETGLEVGTDLVFKFAKQDNLPLSFVVNFLDKDDANFDNVLTDIREAYGKNAIPFLIPINSGINFNSVADIINQKIYTFSTDGKGKMSSEEPTGDIKDKIEGLREELIEAVAETDEALLEKFFDEGTLSDEELISGIKKAIVTRDIFPVYAVSAYNNIGTGALLNCLTNYSPSPEQCLPAKAIKDGKEVELKIDDNAQTSLFIFKTSAEAHVGELSIYKVMSGKASSGTDLYNAKSGKTERIAQVFCINGRDKIEIAHLHAGDIGCVVKLKSTHTADTLAEKGYDIVFPQIVYPLPVIREAVEPKSRADEDKIKDGLQTLADEDPTFHFEYNPEIKQTIIFGMGDLHLKILLERLKEKFNVEVNIIKPRIPYKETIKKRAIGKYRHKKQSGGAGQFGEVWLKIAPAEKGHGIEFKNSLVGQNIDRVFVPSVEKGVLSACEEGVLAGYTVTDVIAEFYDGKMHPVDSKDIAFQIAGKGAFKKAFLEATPILLEPIYDIEIIVPEEYMGDVMGDISTRRGKVTGMGSEGRNQKVAAQVPLGELYHYGTALRSMTQGKGLFSQQFSHYDTMPRDTQEKIIAESNKEEE